MKSIQTILITGASRGIGLQLAIRFIELGHRVIAVSRSVDQLEQLDIQDDKLQIIQYDISQNLAPLVNSLSGVKLDHIVNNAGYLVNKKLADQTDEEIVRQYNVNAIAPLRIVRDLLEHMNSNSSICNISSMGGVQGTAKFPGLCAYSSSKGALSILTECLAEELKDKSIRCNALALGAVQTEMLEAAFPGYVASYSPREMAEYIAEFVLNSSKFYNGKILPVSSSTP